MEQSVWHSSLHPTVERHILHTVNLPEPLKHFWMIKKNKKKQRKKTKNKITMSSLLLARLSLKTQRLCLSSAVRNHTKVFGFFWRNFNLSGIMVTSKY